MVNTCRCLESKIVFNTDTLEKIVNTPQWVLDNEETFWSQEKAQIFTRQWAEQVNHPIDYEKWRQTIRDWSELPLEERKQHIFMKDTKRILEGKEIFLKQALPHLCSYLPNEAELDITIHFTSFIPPRAFAMGEVVINISATYWNNNTDNILNAQVHEIFHVGYSYCQDIRSEENPEDESLYGLIEALHNEGVCTYVAYKALPIFPAPDDKDYPLLEDRSQVKRLLRTLNDVFSKVGVLTEEEVEKLAWQKCVIERAYYVVGAYMCKTIEERKGKEDLKETLLQGPTSFLRLYNSVADPDMEVSLFK